jgi:hypothetical protein
MFSDNLSSEGGSRARLLQPPSEDVNTPLIEDEPGDAEADGLYESQVGTLVRGQFGLHS